MTEIQIIEQLRSGNHSVFAQLYNHYDLIENYILQNNGNKDDAKDVFQNTLIVFYKNSISNNFELSAKISTYLYSIAKNLWLKKLRDEKFKKIELQEQHHETEELITNVSIPEITLREYLKNKLIELGEPCLSLLLMHSYEKLSMSMITQKLGYANEHTTRQQKYKCLKRIRKMIPEDEKRLYLSE